jgi:hypothetical protein
MAMRHFVRTAHATLLAFFVRTAHATLCALLLAGCTHHVTPHLDLPVSPLSAAQLEREGHLFRTDNPQGRVVNFLAFLRVREPATYDTAVFSVSPETLAALLIATAPQHGWQVQSEATSLWPHIWSVTLLSPRPHEVMIQAGDNGQGSEIKVGDGTLYLPPMLFPPLRAAVIAYLSAHE